MVLRVFMMMLLMLVTMVSFPSRASAQSIEVATLETAFLDAVTADPQSPEERNAAVRAGILRNVNGDPAPSIPTFRPIRVLPALAVDLAAAGPEARMGTSMAQDMARRSW
jgi:hypothetical protein